MSSDSDDAAWGIGILTLPVMVPWMYLLGIHTDLTGGNAVFWALVISGISFAGWWLPEIISAKAMWIILGVCAFVSFGYVMDQPFVNHSSHFTIFLSVASGTLAFTNLSISVGNLFVTIGRMPERRQAERNSRTAQGDFESFFDSDDDGSFDYQESNFGASGSRNEEPAPRGFDGRHPDDASLWAYVDDPQASDQERKTALDKILKRQAKRGGKTGRNVVPTAR